MNFRTKTTETPHESGPWAPTSRRNKRIILSAVAIIVVILIADFVLYRLLGWLSKRQVRILDMFLFSFAPLILAYFTIIQVRHCRLTGQDRISMGPFKVNRRAYELQQIGFFVEIIGFLLILFGAPVPDEIIRPILFGGMAMFIAGFAGVFGATFGTGFATLGVILSAGGALYYAIAGTENTKPIIQSVIYAGMGLVAVGMIMFFIRRWRRRNESKGGDGHE
jgi:MFS family permease